MTRANNRAASNRVKGGRGPILGAAAGLVALLGVTATTYLLESVPEDESGRRVEATVTAQGDATVRHISGKQYLKTYIDIAGIPTACDGITRGVRRGQRYTEEQCTALLIKEIEIHARGVMRCAPALKRHGMEGPRIAFISAGFNIGVGGFCGSSMKREMARGNTVRACDALLRWNKARVRGKLRPVRGLTNRRNRERQMCLTGIKPGYTFGNLDARMKRWK